ncbi:MAG: glycosyl transferase, family 2 [Myxococcaceae bacterium]|nr:glycosyl transferase, family 2 [Myxococcaceae bacterium]
MSHGGWQSAGRATPTAELFGRTQGRASAARARVAVVVPAYNEERLIARTIQSIPAFVEHVVVVDDASLDRTAQAASALSDPRVEVVRHAYNRGVGAAIVTGYRAAFARGAEVCAVMAGDAQMDPADLWSLIEPVLSGQADYAKGDRLSYPRARVHMPLTRWLGNGLLSRLTQLVTGLRIRDSQCGYTALSARAASLLPLEQLWPRYGYPNDLLGMLSEHDLAVRDVVVRPIYADEVSGLGLRHALFVIPYVLARVLGRRLARTWSSPARLSALSADSEAMALEALEAKAE